MDFLKKFLKLLKVRNKCWPQSIIMYLVLYDGLIVLIIQGSKIA